jgi:hypothetical protein
LLPPLRDGGCVACLIVAIGAGASACTVSHQPQLVTIPQPGVRAASRLDDIADYRTAAATISTIFERDLGFPPFPARFEFYPHREAFEKALLAVGYDAALARSTAAIMTAVGGYRGVMLNDGKFGLLPMAERVATLAHELGHSLQYELGGGTRGASDQWLREGFAEWLSIRVLERLRAVSMTTVRRERQRELRAAGRSRVPRLAELVTFPAWVHAGKRYGATMYGLSFIAVDVLLERHGMPAVLEYFRRFAVSDDRVGIFRASFGEDIQAFEASLAVRLWR